MAWKVTCLVILLNLHLQRELQCVDFLLSSVWYSTIPLLFACIDVSKKNSMLKTLSLNILGISELSGISLLKYESICAWAVGWMVFFFLPMTMQQTSMIQSGIVNTPACSLHVCLEAYKVHPQSAIICHNLSLTLEDLSWELQILHNININKPCDSQGSPVVVEEITGQIISPLLCFVARPSWRHVALITGDVLNRDKWTVYYTHRNTYLLANISEV